MQRHDSVRLADDAVLAMLRGLRAHTVDEAEIADLVADAADRGARTVAVGHGRDPASVDAAHRFVASWTDRGGEVATVESWPEDAASWLRPTTRLCADDPDLWLLTGPPLGVAQMIRRLLASTSWRADATLLTSQATHPWLRWGCPPGSLSGLVGRFADGSVWRPT